VLLDGQLLTGGVVTTLPERGRGARGEIDSQGRFTLSSGDLGEGATLGTHRVAVVAVDETGEFRPEAPKKLITPEKYATAETSGLSIDVRPGNNSDVVLRLNSK
jgi:hypothetical protein